MVRAHQLRDNVHFAVLRWKEVAERTRAGASAIADVPRPDGRAVALVLFGGVILLLARPVLEAAPGAGGAAARGSSPAVVSGGKLADTLIGTAHADSLNGAGGNDAVLGYEGNDVLAGADGNDFLEGGSGDDVLWAGSGADVLIGGSGNDRLYARALDGSPDRLVCGAGKDVAHVVSINGRLVDKVFGCESIHVTAVTLKRRR